MLAPSASCPVACNDLACDVAIDEIPWDDVGAQIQKHLAFKGFCTVNPGLLDVVLKRAQDESQSLGAREGYSIAESNRLDCFGNFSQPSPAVAEGLLGSRGSALVTGLGPPPPAEADAVSSSVPSSVTPETVTLHGLDQTLTDILEQIWPSSTKIFGSEKAGRTAGILHQAGDPFKLIDMGRCPPMLEEQEASHWISVFRRHRLMIVLFLGPGSGILELRPHACEDAHTFKVKTSAGSMMVLRPDLLSHRHVNQAAGDTALSCFVLGAGSGARRPLPGCERTPAARELDAWIVDRLRELSHEQQVQGGFWTPGDISWNSGVPFSWRKDASRSFDNGRMMSVQSAACHLPGSSHLSSWVRASGATGPDYVGEVPYMRWDHSEVYSSEVECKQGKTYCKHAAFIEGIELFDCAAFGMSVEEARSMDPQQRMTLEVGYSALFSLGLRKKSLRNQACGVYLGASTTSEWQSSTAGGSSSSLDSGGQAASSRLSYMLGLKGPTAHANLEGAAGLGAACMAVDAVRKDERLEFALAAGVHLCLSPRSWPAQSASGWLSRLGRCLTFDASADGYVRGDGCCAATICHFDIPSESDSGTVTSLGCIAGSMLKSSGSSAGLACPDGRATQEVVLEALQRGKLEPEFVDCVEANGLGMCLADAVDMVSLLQAHRPALSFGQAESKGIPLALGALKASTGHQVECAGLMALLRGLASIRLGNHVAQPHLRQINPYVSSSDHHPSLLTTVAEAMELCEPSLYSGVLARGFGGSTAYATTWGFGGPAGTPPQPSQAMESSLVFWPAGGGSLDASMRPQKAYMVVGTWSCWQGTAQMDLEGNGRYGFTMTLGENRWEQFQIWLDGDPARALHPPHAKAAMETQVMGPDSGARGKNWLVDGRSGALAGQPGDRYRLNLHIAGRWRTVTWEKLEEPGLSSDVPRGQYFLTASWANWGLQEMVLDQSADGLFRADVTLEKEEGEFQIVRNNDWLQVLYPVGDDSGNTAGPDDLDAGRCWKLTGAAGDVFRIQLQRAWKQGGDHRDVSWQKLRSGSAPVSTSTAGDKLQSEIPGGRCVYCLVGSWDNWCRPRAMTWDSTKSCWKGRLRVGETGEENFYILKDGADHQAIFPNCRNARPGTFHVVQGPGANPHKLSWRISNKDGAAPGIECEVRLQLDEAGIKPKKLKVDTL